MTKETGGPAFPYEERTREGEPFKDYFGMTLRDYFAAKAMQGLLVDAHCGAESVKDFAESAYIMADAMIKAREQA